MSNGKELWNDKRKKRSGGKTLRKQRGNHDILSPPSLKISTPEDHPETPLEPKGT